jgi:hypothetical protein
VVVVAELFCPEARARAAAAVGEDVAALVLFWHFVCGVVHGPLPTGCFVCKVFEEKEIGLDLEVSNPFSVPSLRLKAEARLLGRASFVFSIYV